MKRASIVFLVVVMVFVGLVSVFVGVGVSAELLRQPPQQTGLNPYEGFETATTQPSQSPQPPQTKGRITGPNEPPMIVGDANEIRTRIKKFEGLEPELQRIDEQSKTEEQEWTEMENENRLELVRAVKAQMKEELLLLRKMALEEKAEKTAAAIDGLLLSRQGRFAQVIQKIEEEEARIAAREERAQRNTGTGRSLRRGTDQTMTGQGGTGTPQGTRTTTRRRR